MAHLSLSRLRGNKCNCLLIDLTNTPWIRNSADKQNYSETMAPYADDERVALRIDSLPLKEARARRKMKPCEDLANELSSS